jgi:TetR/AcrR family transcriptional regulator, cholesterol catabolism regulator
LERAQALGLGPADTLRQFVPRYAAAILRAQRNIAINIREEKNLDPADAERLAALRQQFIAGIEGLLRACRDSGEIEVSDPRVAAFVLVGAVSWTTFWYNPGGVLSCRGRQWADLGDPSGTFARPCLKSISRAWV